MTSTVLIDERTLIKFADSTKLGWAARLLKDGLRTQMEEEKVDKLEGNSIRAQINN